MQTLSQLVQSFRDGGPVMWPILILSVVVPLFLLNKFLGRDPMQSL